MFIHSTHGTKLAVLAMWRMERCFFLCLIRLVSSARQWGGDYAIKSVCFSVWRCAVRLTQTVMYGFIWNFYRRCPIIMSPCEKLPPCVLALAQVFALDRSALCVQNGLTGKLDYAVWLRIIVIYSSFVCQCLATQFPKLALSWLSLIQSFKFTLNIVYVCLYIFLTSPTRF